MNSHFWLFSFFMKKILFSYLFYLICYCSCSAQDINFEKYHEQINKSKSIEYADLESKIQYYRQAFENKNPFPKDLMSLSFYYFLDNDKKSSLEYFRKAIRSGYQFEEDSIELKDMLSISYDFDFIDSNDSLNDFNKFQKYFYEKYINILREERNYFISQIDEIQNQLFEDILQHEYYSQTSRLKLLPKAELSDTVRSAMSKYLYSGNSYILLDLLRDEKFPYRTKCRRFNPQTIGLILNHAVAGFFNKADAKEFIDLLWKEVERGNISPRTYGSIYDHYISWYVSKDKSVLGTKTIYDIETKKIKSMDLLYPQKVDSLRNRYWLIDLKTFYKQVGWDLPSNYINDN
ncbi:hypothetical protein [Flavobacterium sp. CS20]|uniref:hypothetical protein n=1 Tax=Flavobacterium sp. CS20 TaxID=2775246 RepID=UPI001B39EFC6|nr:hypothetical protein [Flavobacterium sp. CS20]QTY25998.1 hypothetical protein IGB25_08245 [Flavobacterium sp. CS20]